MKLLVVSDSHGNVDNMVRAVEQVQPDRILHLGDGWRDAEELHAIFPHIPLDQVPGNCDFLSAEPPVKVLCVEDKRIVMCHGHTYRVKEGLLDAGYAAQEQQADLFLFGHTHRPTQEWAGKSLMVNPGSIGYWGNPSYAVVTIDGGKLTADLCRLNEGTR